jgi:hypothetical protein
MKSSDKKLEEIKVETEKDDKPSIVRQFIREGWPENKYDIPNKIYEYWNCKYELPESKGSSLMLSLLSVMYALDSISDTTSNFPGL